MFRFTRKKVTPIEQRTLRITFDSLFPTAEERVEQSCNYTLRLDNPKTVIKQYSNGTLYYETESKLLYDELQLLIEPSYTSKSGDDAENEFTEELGHDNNVYTKFINPIPASVTSWIGSDECGKGDYFGPLVTAAVMVNSETIPQLLQLEVRDSKELSDNKIEALAAHIRVICDGKFSVVTTMPERYNELLESGFCKGNSLWLLGWQHAKAVENILKEHPEVNYALIDKFSNEKFVLDARTDISRHVTFVFRHRAEQNIAVAAASILARQGFSEG